MKKTIEVDGYTLDLVREEAKVIVFLPKADVNMKNTDVFKLSVFNEYFVQQDVRADEVQYQLAYNIKNATLWEESRHLPYHEKLRLVINASRFFALLPTRFTVLLHPDNLVYDMNLLPLGLYRGIKKMMIPLQQDETEVLRQYKALIISTLDLKYTFADLYGGSLEVITGSRFLQSISEGESLTNVLEILEAAYMREKEQADTTMQLIARKQNTASKRIYVILAILLGVSIMGIGYFIFNRGFNH